MLEAATGAGALQVLRENDIVGSSRHGYWPRRCYNRLGRSALRAPRRQCLCIRGPNNDVRQVLGSIFLTKPGVISRLSMTCVDVVKGDPRRMVPGSRRRARSPTKKAPQRAGSTAGLKRRARAGGLKKARQQ